MRTPPLILIADDNPMNVDVLQARLAAHDYELVTAADGEQALAAARAHLPDLILLDVDMPKMDGLEVCRRLRADDSIPFIPIIMVTAKADSADVVAGLNAGSDEYLTKPVDGAALVARVKSMLRIKALHDTVQAQTAQLTEWNRTLEERVAAQVSEIERVSGLRRFLSPQVAEAILSAGTERILESHRREITVAFCDLRGFTAFSETAEPEELMGVLHEYHAALGEVIFRFEGTLERFAGDGLMIFFNDPVPCPDPALRAVRMAVEMRTRVTALAAGWRKRGHQLGFGMGIALGFATLGRIGFEGRSDYGAIGAVTNLASRLCGEALAGQILISQRVCAMVEDAVDAEPLGELTLKGLSRPVTVFNVLQLREPAG
ncbi:MAG TPA: response regulator [bacterium]|nr:response regulator [bacterium]